MNGQETFALPCLPGIESTLGWCTLVGHWETRSHNLRNRSLSEMVLIYCQQGKGQFFHGAGAFSIEAGDVFCCFPMVLHGYQADKDEGWGIYWLHCKGSYPLELVQRAGFSAQCPILKLGQSAAVEGRFKELLQIARNHEAEVDWQAANALQRLLFEFNKNKAYLAANALESAMSYKDDNLEEIALRAGYSKFHYCRLFKKQMGLSPWAYLTRLKINKARELLLGTQRSIKQVSAELKFENPDYFAKVFKEHTGVSPRNYRGQRKEF